MVTNSDYKLPVWAPRLKKLQIERLYKSCGQGIIDKELIDDVGFSLYARCKSILEATEAARGRPLCPNCKITVKRIGNTSEVLNCLNCGWKCPWQMYKKTYQRKGLFAGRMETYIKEFVQKFQNSRFHSDKLILIDTLIHRFHEESEGKAGGRPAAISFIEGKMKNIMAFLDHLNYGNQIPAEVKQNREKWRKNWSNNPWSKGKGQ